MNNIEIFEESRIAASKSHDTISEKLKKKIRNVSLDFAKIRDARIENALFLINSAFDKVKISLILPMLADNLEHMQRALQGTAYSTSVQLLSRLFHFQFSKDVYVDLEIIKIITYFHKNSVIYEFFPRYMNVLPSEDQKLLLACNSLYNVAQRRLRRTAKVEIDLEKQLCDMYEKKEEIMDRVLRMEKRLKSRFISLRWKNAAKSVVLDGRERELAERKWKNSIFIQNEM